MLRATSQFTPAETAFQLCISAKSRGFDGANPTYIAYAHNEYGHMLTLLGRGGEATAQVMKDMISKSISK